MKVLVVVVFIGCIAAALCDANAIMKQITDGCVKQTGIGADAWARAEKAELSDPKMPDYLFCVYRKLNFINDKGEYLLDAMKLILTQIYSEEHVAKYMKECTKKSYGNGRETAMHLTQCTFDTFPEGV